MHVVFSHVEFTVFEGKLCFREVHAYLGITILDQVIDPLQLGSCDQIFIENVYIMGNNLKNARNRKSALKISKKAEFEAPGILK